MDNQVDTGKRDVIQLAPKTEESVKHLKSHGYEWYVIKFHPRVQAFEGPGFWIQSKKDGTGMWIRCGIDELTDEENGKLALNIDDPDYELVAK